MLEWYDFGARFYDPVLGRWFNVDPAIQFANPYLFCGNAPMMYIDQDGRLAWFIPIIIGAVVGGVSNVVANWDDIGNFWQGLKFFGIGAAVGGLAGYAGYGAGLAVSNAFTIQAGALYGAAVGGAAGAASGVVNGAGMAWVNGFSLQDGLMMGLKSGLIGGTIGMATGGILEGVRAVKHGAKFFSGETVRPQNNYTPISLSDEEARELFKQALNDDGLVQYDPQKLLQEHIEYPPNDGFQGSASHGHILPESTVSRYGGTSGRYFAPERTAPQNLSLPPNTNPEIHDIYRILKPLPVEYGPAAPAFGQPGGGIQYKAPLPSHILEKHGIIEKITPKPMQ